eukprot:gene11271-15122_t
MQRNFFCILAVFATVFMLILTHWVIVDHPSKNSQLDEFIIGSITINSNSTIESNKVTSMIIPSREQSELLEIKKWFEENGVCTKYSSNHDLKRQIYHMIRRMRPGIDEEWILKSNFSFLRQEIFPFIGETKDHQKYTQIVDRNSPLVVERLKTIEQDLPDSSNGISIVIPFHADELNKVSDWFSSSKMYESCSTCAKKDGTNSKKAGVYFVWAFAGSFDSPAGRVVKNTLKHLWNEYSEITYHEPINYRYSSRIQRKFQYSAYFANFCEDIYDTSQIFVERPDIYLVHSKSVYLSNNVKLLFESIASVSDQYFTVSSLKPLLLKVLPLFYSGELDSSNLKPVVEKVKSLVYDSSQLAKVQITSNFSTISNDKFYIWTSDFHSGPINCQMPIFREAGAVVHAEVDYGNCIYSGYCKDRLKVLKLDEGKGFSLENNGLTPHQTTDSFHEAYVNDPEFQRVDAFFCSHPVANCQLYIPFQKPIIIFATTRLEFGRDDGGIFWRLPYWTEEKGAVMWKKWIKDLRQLAKNPRNIIAANNLYDVHYINYFAGVQVTYIPSWCGDLNHEFDAIRNNLPIYQPIPTYSPSKDRFLLGPYRTNLDLMRNGSTTSSPELHPITIQMRKSQVTAQHAIAIEFMQIEFKNGYVYGDLVKYSGIVLFPYQVSSISFFEFYRLNIPLFIPSIKLLKEWHSRYDILWERIYGWPKRLINIKTDLLDPNSNSNESFAQWIEYADYYNFPHVQLFDNFDQLFSMLASSDLYAISRAMKKYNQKSRSVQ